jgi:type I restriction enzyme S subunit
MSDELPNGWVGVRLEDLVSSRKGKKPDVAKDAPTDGFVAYLDIQAIETGKVSSYAEAASSRLATADDLLVVWDGARSGWVGLGRPGAIGSTIAALLPKVGSRLFLYRWLQSQFKSINTNTRGTGIPHVDPEVFWNLEVPFAPLPEQSRIATKVQVILEKIDGSQQKLAKIPLLLKRFRKSVLAAACSGRLTADWRDDNGISAEASWRDTELRDICSTITDGDHLPPPKRPSGIPFLTIGNVSSGRLDFSETRFVPESYFAKIKADRIPKRGDILYTVVGATIGIPILVDTDRAFCFQRHIAILKPSKAATSKFLHVLMGSPAVFQEAWARTTGTAQPTLPLGGLRSIPVSTPSLPEQQEVVRRVEKLFALADQIEARFREAQKRVDSITQSVLAKAFRGELVPTEYELAKANGRSFESAEELLESIRKNGDESAKFAKAPRKKARR